MTFVNVQEVVTRCAILPNCSGVTVYTAFNPQIAYLFSDAVEDYQMAANHKGYSFTKISPTGPPPDGPPPVPCEPLSTTTLSNYELKPNMMNTPNTLFEIKYSTVNNCSYACDTETTCKGFTFSNDENRVCTLKTSFDDPRTYLGVDTYTKI
jgi:hypothetical protein